MQDTAKQLQDLIFQRYAAISEKTLFQIYQLESDLFVTPPEVVHFLCAERQQVRERLKNELMQADSGQQSPLLSLFLRLTKQFVYQKNQFVSYTPQDEMILKAIYRRFLHNLYHLVTQADSPQTLQLLFRDVLVQHHLALRAFTARFLNEADLSPEHHFLFSQPVCEEYSEHLQWELFGLDYATLQEPVLDLGCGQHGRFVHFLRSQGIEAYGIDRICHPMPFLTETDWFQFHYQPETWGTILSHLAFSNHFLFQHAYKHGTPERCARLFMTILAALKPDGTFHYTPGLPFFEPLLPSSTYEITRTSVTFQGIGEFQTNSPYHDLLGQDVNYAVQIRKIARSEIAL
ncbi:methyltransferase type 11 [Candidatus Vecturithrix granuli]|uniref:Methyltransferase type 11 n=1 Tax=Vecturithrix granuli TaxID=1499967 RepID=A0A081BYF9_VECG1|nr:methyltransferase type 11 [Candidatus Vecturithrix granuli]